MANNDIQYLIVKLQGIQKQLGGPMDNLVKPESDEFNRVKLALTENINFITKKQDERDNIESTAGRTMAVIKAGIDIKDRLSDTEDQISQMKDALRRQRKNPKKYPENQIEVKEKQLENCRRMVEQLTVRENGGTIDSEEKPISLTDMKLRLNGGGGRRNPNTYVQKDLSQDEANALKAFQEKDRELDSMIMQIDEGLGMLRNKAEMMGEKIDNHHDLIADLDNEVGKTVAQLETENAKLKKVLYEYRKPGQFCMNVICLLVLMGLIGVIIKMSSQ